MPAVSRSFYSRPEADGHTGMGSVRPSHCPVDTPAKGRPPLYPSTSFLLRLPWQEAKGWFHCITVCVCVCVRVFVCVCVSLGPPPSCTRTAWLCRGNSGDAVRSLGLPIRDPVPSAEGPVQPPVLSPSSDHAPLKPCQEQPSQPGTP